MSSKKRKDFDEEKEEKNLKKPVANASASPKLLTLDQFLKNLFGDQSKSLSTLLLRFRIRTIDDLAAWDELNWRNFEVEMQKDRVVTECKLQALLKPKGAMTASQVVASTRGAVPTPAAALQTQKEKERIRELLKLVPTVLNVVSTDKKRKPRAVQSVLNMQERISTAMSSIDKPLVRVGLLGAAGHGKSYLINQLLGKEIVLSIDNLENTSLGVTTVPTVLCAHGDDIALSTVLCTEKEYKTRCHQLKIDVDAKVAGELGSEEKSVTIRIPEDVRASVPNLMKFFTQHTSQTLSKEEGAKVLMYRVTYPFDFLRDNNIELVDFPGYPDPRAPVDPRLHIAPLARKLEVVLLFLGQMERPSVQPDDLVHLHECGLFQPGSQFPKVVFTINKKHAMQAWLESTARTANEDVASESKVVAAVQAAFNFQLYDSPSEADLKLARSLQEQMRKSGLEPVKYNAHRDTLKMLARTARGLLVVPHDKRVESYTTASMFIRFVDERRKELVERLMKDVISHAHILKTEMQLSLNTVLNKGKKLRAVVTRYEEVRKDIEQNPSYDTVAASLTQNRKLTEKLSTLTRRLLGQFDEACPLFDASETFGQGLQRFLFKLQASFAAHLSERANRLISASERALQSKNIHETIKCTQSKCKKAAPCDHVVSRKEFKAIRKTLKANVAGWSEVIPDHIKTLVQGLCGGLTSLSYVTLPNAVERSLYTRIAELLLTGTETIDCTDIPEEKSDASSSTASSASAATSSAVMEEKEEESERSAAPLPDDAQKFLESLRPLVEAALKELVDRIADFFRCFDPFRCSATEQELKEDAQDEEMSERRREVVLKLMATSQLSECQRIGHLLRPPPSVTFTKTWQDKYPQPVLFNSKRTLQMPQPATKPPATLKEASQKPYKTLYSQTEKKWRATNLTRFNRSTIQLQIKNRDISSPRHAASVSAASSASTSSVTSKSSSSVSTKSSPSFPTASPDSTIHVQIDNESRTVTAEMNVKLVRTAIDKCIQSASARHGLYPIFLTTTFRSREFDPKLHIDTLHEQKIPYLMFVVTDSRSLISLPSTIWEDQYKNEVFVVVTHEPDGCRLGIGRQRTIIQLIAEAFAMPEFFMLDDDLLFYEYDPQQGRRVPHPGACARALHFMQEIMNQERVPSDEDSVAARKQKFGELMANIQDNPKTSILTSVVSNKLFSWAQQVDAIAKDPTDFLHQLSAHPQLKEAVEYFRQELGVKGDHVAQVANWNMDNSQTELHHRLSEERQTNYKVTAVRYQAVLYNLDATRGLHMVDDKAFFEKPLPKANLLKSLEAVKQPKGRGRGRDPNTPKFSPTGLELARLGYRFADSFYAMRLLLEQKSGFEAYYFGHRATVKNKKSAVEGDESDVDYDLVDLCNKINMEKFMNSVDTFLSMMKVSFGLTDVFRRSKRTLPPSQPLAAPDAWLQELKTLNKSIRDVPGDGSCLYHAIADQLNETKYHAMEGVWTGARVKEVALRWLQSLGREVVTKWGLVEILTALFPVAALLAPAASDDDETWSAGWNDFVARTYGKDGESGDHLTIWAVCNALNVRIRVYSSQGRRYFTRFDPMEVHGDAADVEEAVKPPPASVLQIGHIPSPTQSDAGHYVSVLDNEDDE